MLRFLTAGESHGPCLTAIIDGLPAGLVLSVEAVNRDLARRQKGYGRGGRMKIEKDQVEIVGGLFPPTDSSQGRGETTGAPVSLRIANRDWANWRDRWAAGEVPALTVPRPGHADHAGMIKYGLADARPVLERASARETAMRVAVGAVAKLLLIEFGIAIGSYVSEIGGVVAQTPDLGWADLWELAENSDVRCPDETVAIQMRKRIDEAREAGDSLGGVVVVAATGLPVGLGSHVQWDRRLDARLAQAVMSIPAIKGVEVGSAFENARRPGTQVHDEIRRAPGQERLHVERATNKAGGIEGGMTNGQPVVVHAAMKPIPTTVAPLRSVDLATGKEAATQYQRSDVCAVPAAAIVGEAVVAWVLADALMEKLGGDSVEEMQARIHGE